MERKLDSPKMLVEMLRFLGHQERPFYQGFKEEVNGREEWQVEVVIKTPKHKPLIFEAYVIRSSFDAGIRDAACQAMYRLRDMYADDLSNTPYHCFPRRRMCNTDKEILHHQHDGGPVLNQQIRLTQALIAVCDDGLDELREARFKVRELEQELMKARRHKQEQYKAIAASSPPPRRRCSVIVGDKKPNLQSPGSNQAITAPAARRRTSAVVVGNTNRRAWLRKPAPTRQSWRGAAPAPCGRRLAGSVVKEEEDSASSFGAAGGGGGSSAHHRQLPQGQGDGYRPPIASTPKTLASSSSSFEGRMHGSNLMAMAVEEGPRRRDGSGTSASSSSFDGRRHGSKLMAFILDGGVALLGKEPADGNNSHSDYDADSTTSAPRHLMMEKP